MCAPTLDCEPHVCLKCVCPMHAVWLDPHVCWQLASLIVCLKLVCWRAAFLHVYQRRHRVPAALLVPAPLAVTLVSMHGVRNHVRE